MNAPLPTKRDEAWRYADLKALATVWSKLEGPEKITVPAGERQSRQIAELPVVDGVGVIDLDVTIGDNATFTLHLLAHNADYGRIHVRATLGNGSHFELGGAILGSGDQTLEIVTETIHAEPNATSNQVVRSVLADKATGSFLGRINVARHAQKTDAAQSVKAMLLDRGATANAKPDKQALFYMASRGLDPTTAKKLMLQAFIADAFVSVDDDAVREAIESKALEVLEGLS